MLTRKELKELASHVMRDKFFISLFLDVDPKNKLKKDEWLLQFKNLARDTTKKMKPEDKKSVKPDIVRIERYLKDRPEGLRRGLALFSSQADDFWRIYHTAMPFTNQMIIDHDPYIKPLAAMVDLYQRYLVIVVRGERARVLIADMGQIEEIKIIINPRPKTDPTRDGSSGDMGEVRARKKKDTSRKQLYRELTNVINSFRRDEGIKRILLGGTESARGRFEEWLPGDLKERVVGDFAVEYNASPTDVLKRCLPLMKEIEYKFERQALDELFSTGGGGAGAVLGLSDVLDAIQQGNVHKLYVMSNMVSPGMVCKVCSALTTERDRPCPFCGGEMRKVNYMLDLAIQKAMDQGARIDMLEKAPRLVKVGGIGALLRY
ncbi:hypothetical protein HQ587_06975 [bacterium]|nr:hypothetical protein [bacterium]